MLIFSMYLIIRGGGGHSLSYHWTEIKSLLKKFKETFYIFLIAQLFYILIVSQYFNRRWEVSGRLLL